MTEADRLPLRLIGSRPSHLARAVLFSALASGAGIALTGTAAWLLSRAAEHPPVTYLMAAIVAVRGFGIGRGVFRYVERLQTHDLALKLQAGLRLHTCQVLARSTWLGRRSGDLLARLVYDVDAIQTLVVRTVVPITACATVSGVAVVTLTAMSSDAGLLLAISASSSLVVVPWIASRLAKRGVASVAPLRGKITTAVVVTSDAAPELVSYGATATVMDAVSQADRELLRAERRAAWVVGLAEFGQTLATGMAVVGCLWVGAAHVSTGDLQATQLAVVVLIPLALQETLSAASPAALAWREASSGLKRVQETLESPTAGTPDQPGREAKDEPPMIKVVDLAAGWPGSDAVVSGLSLRVLPGEKVALTGASGSGKSTVAATILGLLRPISGTISVTGRIGYLAQDAHLFDTTVADNVRIGNPEASGATVATALSRATLPLPLERHVGRHGMKLSGGEARRLAFARLLVSGANVLILDEPTEHLDAAVAGALVDDVWAAAESTGAAVLVITHDPTLVARCDHEVDLGQAE